MTATVVAPAENRTRVGEPAVAKLDPYGEPVPDRRTETSPEEETENEKEDGQS
ncbi:hypothetical protein FHX37_4032 [Haloactinospora alba]|uniref:Uncharacterized protein n=1 Tax=Haloactinospora alba TaxID=405555 RepID=A0A543NA29_9ACTN|nr:hypothetical protein [Haloactinospora alba]TQN28673.1 hypothetical protein FHX37_4032 [Haloactinospora alba]